MAGAWGGPARSTTRLLALALSYVLLAAAPASPRIGLAQGVRAGDGGPGPGVRWRLPLQQPWGAPQPYGNLALVFDQNTVTAVAAESGRTVWRRELTQTLAIGCACLAAPGLAWEEGLVFAIQAGNELLALDAETGRGR